MAEAEKSYEEQCLEWWHRNDQLHKNFQLYETLQGAGLPKWRVATIRRNGCLSARGFDKLSDAMDYIWNTLIDWEWVTSG